MVAFPFDVGAAFFCQVQSVFLQLSSGQFVYRKRNDRPIAGACTMIKPAVTIPRPIH